MNVLCVNACALLVFLVKLKRNRTYLRKDTCLLAYTRAPHGIASRIHRPTFTRPTFTRLVCAVHTALALHTPHLHTRPMYGMSGSEDDTAVEARNTWTRHMILALSYPRSHGSTAVEARGPWTRHMDETHAHLHTRPMYGMSGSEDPSSYSSFFCSSLSSIAARSRLFMGSFLMCVTTLLRAGCAGDLSAMYSTLRT